MPLALASYIVDLSGETIVLPPVHHVPGKVTVFTRRPGPSPDRVLVEALEFEATRVIRPMSTTWPEGPFRCDRAEYVNGELRFHREDDVFGFLVDSASAVTSLAGEVDRRTLEDGGIAGALSSLSSDQGLSAVTLDSSYISPRVEADQELPSAVDTDQFLKTPARPWRFTWAPSPFTGVFLTIIAVGLGWFAAVDLATGEPIVSYSAATAAIVLFIMGILAMVVPHEQLQRINWALMHPSVPLWPLRLLLVLAGIAVAVLGFVMAGRGAETKMAEPGLIGLLLMAVAAVVVGYNLTRLIPPVD